MSAASPVDAVAADTVLENAANAAEKFTFSSLWKEQPAVLVFLRRFGCQICRVHAQDLEQVRPQIEALGAKIACIGHEHFGEGSDFDRSWEAGGYFKGPVYSNPDKSLYKAMFSRKTLWSGYGLFDMSGDRLKQVKERKIPGNFKGDGFQLGGTFVIDTDGTVVLDKRAKFYGDDATNEEILAALKSCKGLKASAKDVAAAEERVAAVAAEKEASAAGGVVASGGAGASSADGTGAECKKCIE